MPGADDGVLVLVCYAVVIRKGFREPVGGADEGCFCVEVLEECQCFRIYLRQGYQLERIRRKIVLTSARCCWPVPNVLSFSAVGVLFPLVANSGVLISTEALVEG